MKSQPPLAADAMSAFSRSYAEARQKFLDAARDAGAALTEFPHPTQRGARGEALAIDVAWVGEASARHCLMISSGMHGVEGFCGAGAQVTLLRDAGLCAAARAADAALLLVHALNPYGFSHLRRVNEDNVDLNRNFLDFSRPLPENAAYAELAPLLLPEHWPASQEDEASLHRMVAEKGLSWFQAAVSAGQYAFPDGLFFGGHKPAWSNYTLRRLLARFGAGRASLRWLDIHTGLGPWGYGEPIYMGPDDARQLANARAIWGREVTSIHDGSSTSASLTGMAWRAIPETLPALDYAGIALEFGTLPVGEVLEALRGDHWLHLHPDADQGQRTLIQQSMWRAFYGDSDDWRAGVLEQVREAALRALAGW